MYENYMGHTYSSKTLAEDTIELTICPLSELMGLVCCIIIGDEVTNIFLITTSSGFTLSCTSYTEIAPRVETSPVTPVVTCGYYDITIMCLYVRIRCSNLWLV